MASSIPAQTRTVDPFASYNSDTVNKLTKMANRGSDGIMARNDLDIVPDSTSPLDHVLMRPGIIYKDEILIDMEQEHRVDFTDPDHYVSFGLGFNEAGTYYIVMQYTFLKSRPAPVARIKILKPSQITPIPHPSLGTSLFFLKAVIVIFNGVSFEISSLSDSDPSDPTMTREYVPLFFGGVTVLPTHDPTSDIGRVVYETSTNTFWFGYSDRWGKISAGVEVNLNTDTTGVFVGALCYTDTNGDAALAIATGVDTGAEMAVVEVGQAVNRSGRATMYGFVEDVQIETGIIINVGDILYLSITEPGKVTNVITNPVRQVVGRAVTGGNSLLPIDILFFPRDVLVDAIVGTILPGEWAFHAPTGYYIEEFDITALDIDSTTPSVLVNVWDATTNMKISPVDVEIIANGTALRVYTNDPSLTWNYIVSAGGGGAGTGGGGAGTTDHSLLFNLDFASANHTGFAPSPHDNAHHSDIYIEASGVTKANLDANGDVGTGAGQVSQGDHTHANLVDVPSGEIVLFESAVQVTGYTLQVDVDDQLIYISSGGAAGTKPASTWSQPNHNHPFSASHSHPFSGSTGFEVVSGANRATGGDSSHIHSFSGTTNITAAAGTTSGGATTSSWRPLGRNFTRQERN